jgi:transposase InsO family protein
LSQKITLGKEQGWGQRKGDTIPCQAESFKQLRAGPDGHRLALVSDTGRPPPDSNAVAAFSVKRNEGSNAVAALPPEEQNPTGCQIREIVVKNHPLVSLVIPITVNGVSTTAVLDTASHVTIVNRDILGEIKLPIDIEKVRLRQASGTDFMDGYVVQQMPLEIDGRKYKWDLVVAPISDPVLLGLDFLIQHRGAVDLADNSVRIGNKVIKGVLRDDRATTSENIKLNANGRSVASASRVTVIRKMVIPPYTIKRIEVQPEHKLEEGKEFIVELDGLPDGVFPFANLATGSNYKAIPAFLFNGTAKYITFKKGQHIGFTSESDAICADLGGDPRVESEHTHAVQVDVDVEPGGLQRSNAVAAFSLEPEVLPRSNAVAAFLPDSGTSDQIASGSLRESTTPSLRQVSVGFEENHLGTNAVAALSASADTEGTSNIHSGSLSSNTSSQTLEKLPEHLEDLYKRSCENLTNEQSVRVAKLLLEFSEIFAKHDLDLGCMIGVEHHINTGDAPPVKQRMRRTPLGFEHEEKKHLDKMLGASVIRPSFSDWASAPVLVRKKDGSVRWCIDYRDLNTKTVKDTFPLPNIEECLDSLAGTQWFSTLDLESGYYQIRLADDDMKKTAFVTREGLFEHTRMGFGLCNAPATFQRAIQLVLVGLTWEEAVAYLNDINVLGKCFEDELTNLREVFKRLQKFNLKLKPRKCHLFRTECEFLGKLITREGVHISPGKVEVVKNWPTPCRKRDVESFLGFANYHRQHIQGFAGIASCLYDLTGIKPFHWSQCHQETFEILKQKLTSAPCLAYPKDGGGFVLDTDASDLAVGAELSQIQDGHERVISYASKVLSPAQRKYCTTRKELLAIVTFTRQFKHYLLGYKFTVRTDHNSLVWLMRFRNADGQLARWLEELSRFDMVVEHRVGKKHSNADGLSRVPDTLESCNCYEAGARLELLPCGGCHYCTRVQSQWQKFENDVDDVLPLAQRSMTVGLDSNTHEPAVRAVHMTPDAGAASAISTEDQQPIMMTQDTPLEKGWIEGYSTSDIHKLQWEDSDLQPIIWWLESGFPPPEHELYLSSAATKALWLCRNQLQLLKGVLYYRWENRPGRKLCLVVPKTLREIVMQSCHDSKVAGHFGRDKTLHTLKRSFLWNNMARDCRIYVLSCAVCSMNKKASKKSRGSLQRYHSGFPMEKVHIDILGPFTTSDHGNKYILVMIDQFSKWVECAALPDQTAEAVAYKFLVHFIVTFGCPIEVYTDQGSNFESNLFQAFCKIFQITKKRTTPYHPSANGQVERVNRTLLQMIRCYIDGNVRHWDRDLPLLVMALHAAENRSTGFSPNMLMLGREVNMPIDLLLGVADANSDSRMPSDWLNQLSTALESAHHLARVNLRTAQKRQKGIYDLHLREQVYFEGDLVYKIDSSTTVGESKKLRSPYKGPYLVVKSAPPIYTIRGRKGEETLHHDRLKICEDRQVPLWMRRLRHRYFELELSTPEDLGDGDGESELGSAADLGQTDNAGDTGAALLQPVADSDMGVDSDPTDTVAASQQPNADSDMGVDSDPTDAVAASQQPDADSDMGVDSDPTDAVAASQQSDADSDMGVDSDTVGDIVTESDMPGLTSDHTINAGVDSGDMSLDAVALMKLFDEGDDYNVPERNRHPPSSVVTSKGRRVKSPRYLRDYDTD